MKATLKFDTRLIWYSVLIWILAFAMSAFIVLPWSYLLLPVIVFWTTVYFFKKVERTLINGLVVALIWFLIILGLDFLELVGPYYANVTYYFSDLRNWILYPLILLTPVIYSLIMENNKLKQTPPDASR